jgi:hypothetical protein
MTTPVSTILDLTKDCVSAAFELVVVQQPTSVRNQYGESVNYARNIRNRAGAHHDPIRSSLGTNVLDPFPVCHLRPRSLNRDPQRLHPHLLLQCHLESLPTPSLPALPGSQQTSLTGLTASLKGQTVVGPRFARSTSGFHASSSTATLTEHSRYPPAGMEEAWFAFRDLGVECAGGQYRLRFMLIETSECVSGVAYVHGVAF